MLKIKTELNYRRGGTARNCGGCDHFVNEFQVMSCNGNPLNVEPRCKVIGPGNSRKYRINQKNVCDRHTNKERLKRLLGEKNFQEIFGGQNATA